MIELKHLDSLQHCIETVLSEEVAGDLIEIGVWRGGACIFMRAVLAAYGIEDRKIFVADSFEGHQSQMLKNILLIKAINITSKLTLLYQKRRLKMILKIWSVRQSSSFPKRMV